MEKRRLGRTGMLVSTLGLGTVKFGRNQGVKYPQGFALPDDAQVANLMARAQALGINVLDTAPAYGTAEERVGALRPGRREDWIIISKAGEEFENGHSVHDFTPAHIERSLLRSLRRLRTDYLDILLIHSDGRDEEILADPALIETLQGFKSRGLARAVGASTKTVAGGLMAARTLDVVMVTHNPSYTQEAPVIAAAMESGCGVLVKKALESGHSASPADSLRFVASTPGVASIIVGTLNPEHLSHNAAAIA